MNEEFFFSTNKPIPLAFLREFLATKDAEVKEELRHRPPPEPLGPEEEAALREELDEYNEWARKHDFPQMSLELLRARKEKTRREMAGMMNQFAELSERLKAERGGSEPPDDRRPHTELRDRANPPLEDW